MKLRASTIALAALLAPLPAHAAPDMPDFDVAASKAAIDATLDQIYPHLDAVYRDIHAHPELGFQEKRTAALLAAEMRKLGFTATEGVGKTGIVAILRNGDGPTVMVRTEMDGLPMEEKTGLPFASRAQQDYNGALSFVDHSCGHDTHMAAWLGTAKILVDSKAKWHGTLIFVGQPAEEALGGALAMIADGLFTRFPKPDVGFAAHAMSGTIGDVLIKDGTAMSAADAFAITFNGVGAHGSMPDKSIDPIVMGGHFVTDVQSVISREKEAATFGVLTIGSFQAGSAPNIISDKAELKLSMRSFDPATRQLLIDGVTRTANAVAAMARAPAPTIVHIGGTAALVNDSALAARARTVMTTAFGTQAKFQSTLDRPNSASEDYSDFVAAGVPSMFYFVSGTDPKLAADYAAKGQPVPTNHSPFFAPLAEPTIRRIAETLALSVMMVAAK